MTSNTTSEAAESRDIITTRILNAPRELVFKVWTDPEHIIKWWGPDGFTNTIHEMEVKPGGVWRFMMHGPDGTDYPNKIVYTKVVPPELLEYEHSGDDDSDRVFHVRVSFEALDGKTRLTMRMLFATAEERNRVIEQYGALEGQQQTLNKLEAYLAVVVH